MSLLKRVKEIGEDLADTTRRGAVRGKLEIEVRRLEGKISDEKDAIGHALYPMLESGALTVDDMDVRSHMARVAELSEEVAAKRKEIEELGAGDDEHEEQAAPGEPTALEGEAPESEQQPAAPTHS